MTIKSAASPVVWYGMVWYGIHSYHSNLFIEFSNGRKSLKSDWITFLIDWWSHLSHYQATAVTMEHNCTMEPRMQFDPPFLKLTSSQSMGHNSMVASGILFYGKVWMSKTMKGFTQQYEKILVLRVPNIKSGNICEKFTTSGDPPTLGQHMVLLPLKQELKTNLSSSY